MFKKKASSDLVKLSAMDEDILTGLLGRKLYGLEILNLLNDGRQIKIGFGSLYPALNRLEKKGLVSWKWGDESDATEGSRRKYYEVSGFGEKTLLEVQEYRLNLARKSKKIKPELENS